MGNAPVGVVTVSSEYQDWNYWTLRIRTHEWAEHQLVSLLEINGVGKATVRALWRSGVTTAAILREADAEALARQLREHGIGQSPTVIRGWQQQVEELWTERQMRLEASPAGDSRERRQPRLQVREMPCPACGAIGYVVRGHRDPRCPECGTSIRSGGDQPV